MTAVKPSLLNAHSYSIYREYKTDGSVKWKTLLHALKGARENTAFNLRSIKIKPY